MDAGLIVDAAPYLWGGSAAYALAARYGWPLQALWSDTEVRRSLRQAAAMRRRWRRHAYMLKMVVYDTSPRGVERLKRRAKTARTRAVWPGLRTTADEWGVVVDAPTVPGIGHREWTQVAPHLADTWRCTRVTVASPQPGAVRLRAIRRDPLVVPTVHQPTGEIPASLRQVEMGRDEYAEPVSLRLDSVPGVCVAGLPGFGKTCLINGLIVRLAPSPAVQFAFFDGKSEDVTQGDYADMADRAFMLCGDDPVQAHEALTELNQLRRDRQSQIRSTLGTTNMWRVGPSVTWPLVVVVIDEAQTYFQQVRDGGNPEIKKRNALAAQNALMVERLIKLGRSVGIVVVVSSQKVTADAVPTAIRDVCPVRLAFASMTREAAEAALGDDISRYPDADPVALQDPAYIGVATMRVQGRAGFRRVRFPEVIEADAVAICQATAPLTNHPAALLRSFGGKPTRTADAPASRTGSGAAAKKVA
jgi:DNA segregation ATPase FtsK/SpoIIIE, S-DNA-T family